MFKTHPFFFARFALTREHLSSSNIRIRNPLRYLCVQKMQAWADSVPKSANQIFAFLNLYCCICIFLTEARWHIGTSSASYHWGRGFESRFMQLLLHWGQFNNVESQVTVFSTDWYSFICYNIYVTPLPFQQYSPSIEFCIPLAWGLSNANMWDFI